MHRPPDARLAPSSRQLIVVRMGLTESGPGVICGLVRQLVEAFDAAA